MRTRCSAGSLDSRTSGKATQGPPVEDSRRGAIRTELRPFPYGQAIDSIRLGSGGSECPAFRPGLEFPPRDWWWLAGLRDLQVGRSGALQGPPGDSKGVATLSDQGFARRAPARELVAVAQVKLGNMTLPRASMSLVSVRRGCPPRAALPEFGSPRVF